MKILEVIPVAKGIPVETLTYFSASEIPLGSMIKVPLRKKSIPAIVVGVRDASELKSEIKNSSFALKKIENVQSHTFLQKEFIQAAQDAAEYYVGTTGAVLSALVPKYIFENRDQLKIPKNDTERKNQPLAEKFVIQANDEDRYAHYKSIIREEFAKGASVFFCLPTIQDIRRAESALSKGIEPYTFLLHSNVAHKEIVEIINIILEEKHPVLIIATGGFLSVPRNDIHTIIVDKENSRAYKMQSRSFLDIRKFAELFAKKNAAKIIFGDMLLRAETIYRFQNGDFVEVAPLKFRSLTTCSEILVDMRAKKDAALDTPTKKQLFQIFSPELEENIKKASENNEQTFLFCARRGLSPSTVCADCGNIVGCKNCGAHVVLHSAKTGNFFLCHRCGARADAYTRCAYCDSSRLTTLGIASELIAETLKQKFPNKKIFRLDADTATTHKRALKVCEAFYANPASILVGTEMALPYLEEPIKNTAVVSLDTFFSIPDFRINERILNILLKLRSISEKSLIIQTRDPEQKVFGYALSGNLIDYFRDEIADRKMLMYPPMSVLIKISMSGTKSEIAKLTEIVHETILPYEIDIFPAFVPHAKGKFGVNGIIKVPAKDWPDKKLSETLRSLPMSVSVNVDPDSLL